MAKVGDSRVSTPSFIEHLGDKAFIIYKEKAGANLLPAVTSDPKKVFPINVKDVSCMKVLEKEYGRKYLFACGLRTGFLEIREVEIRP